MAIPAEIQEVIRLAQIQQTEESKLETYRSDKSTHQSAIAELNQKITDQSAVVSAARLELKAAAAKL